MEPLVAAATISAVGAVLAATAAALINKERQKTREAEKEAEAAKALAAKAAAAAVETATRVVQRVPYSIEKLRTTIVVDDTLGGGTIHRELVGLRLRPGERLVRYKTRLRTSGAFDKLHPVQIDHPNIGKGISPSYSFSSSTTCDVVVEFVPFLADTDPPLNVSVRVRTTAAQLLKRAEIAKAYEHDQFKHEYVAEAIDCEVKELRIEVQFPPGQRPQTFPMVFPFASEEIAAEQLRDVPAIDESVPDRATLIIQRPSPSFRYAIYWLGLD